MFKVVRYPGAHSAEEGQFILWGGLEQREAAGHQAQLRRGHLPNRGLSESPILCVPGNRAECKEPPFLYDLYRPRPLAKLRNYQLSFSAQLPESCQLPLPPSQDWEDFSLGILTYSGEIPTDTDIWEPSEEKDSLPPCHATMEPTKLTSPSHAYRTSK